jgi:hypothetical protein
LLDPGRGITGTIIFHPIPRPLERKSKYALRNPDVSDKSAGQPDEKINTLKSDWGCPSGLRKDEDCCARLGIARLETRADEAERQMAFRRPDAPDRARKDLPEQRY